MGLWFSTLQLAFTPQEPGQGSWQRWPMQARLGLQWAWMVHSGLQPWGDEGSPIMPATQVQMAWLFLIWQFVFLPQGDGEQGSDGREGGRQPWKGFPV